MRVDTEAALEGLVEGLVDEAPPDFAVVLLPTLLLMDSGQAQGHPANVCVDMCLTLKDTYRLWGIDARITPVSVDVDPPGGQRYLYGGSPRWDGMVFRGHCVLWLPSLGRLVDPTIQQFSELAGRDGPFIGRVVASNDVNAVAGPMPIGAKIPIARSGVGIVYTVEGTEGLITAAEAAQVHYDLNPKAAAMLAAWGLSFLRTPEIVDRIRSAPFPRIHALLDAIGDAEVDVGDRHYRLHLPGPDGRLTPTWVDDIDVPV